MHKQGKDELLIKNWRPISLLCVDFKILTKSLAMRVRDILPNLIHENQSGFVKNRYIGQGIRLVEDIIVYTDKNDKVGAIVQLDFEKAFDSVSWQYMFDTLKNFNFGKNFIDWVKLCYTNIYSTVINNGFSSGWFRISRGVRQGCPLSCALFVLCC